MRDALKSIISVKQRFHGRNITLRYLPQLRPGENLLIPAAPGLYLKNASSKHIQYDKFAKTSFPGNFIWILILFCFVNRVDAIPVFNMNTISQRQSIDNSIHEGLLVNDSYFNYYPWWANRGLNKSRYNESIPAQELKYNFLENTLYNFVGGSYVPGSIGTMAMQDKSYKDIQIISYDIREYVDFWGRFDISGQPADIGDILNAYIGNYNTGQYIVNETGWYVIRIYRDDPSTEYKEGAVSGDYIRFEAIEHDSGYLHATETSQNLPVWTNNKDRIRVDINALPEPSSVILFGIAAMGFLRMKPGNE